jgi:hypothetical protein
MEHFSRLRGFKPLLIRRCRQSIASPIDALPLDILRIMTGLLLLGYFLRTLLEISDFSESGGLIDHQLTTEIFWFTRLGLFQSWMSGEVFQLIFLFACLCAVFLIIGFQVKLSAALLYLIAVSTYRWNFLVMYVDDSIMHLLLFWMFVLPVGRTLILSDWIKNGRAAWNNWKTVTVPGTALRCFLWNLSLIYLIAGLWKWTSPMWREGIALYVVLKLPISYGHNFWGLEHLPLLKIFNYTTLILEPLFPLMFVLPKGHFTKYALLLGFICLHLGSVATLDIPFANLACTGIAIVIFREELMQWIRGASKRLDVPDTPARMDFSGGIAIFMVVMLTLAMISSVILPQWRVPTGQNFNAEFQTATSSQATQQESRVSVFRAESEEFRNEGLGSVQMTFFGILWTMGIAQQYQLFNWIDDRNFAVHYTINEYQDNGAVRGIDPNTMFLPSTRGVLLQFYIHGITWMRIPPERREELRRSLLTRIAHRYCKNYKPIGKVEVYSYVERIDPRSEKTEKQDTFLMSFGCNNTEPFVQELTIMP